MVGIKKVGERTSLFCKLSEKKREGEICFDENLLRAVFSLSCCHLPLLVIVSRCF